MKTLAALFALILATAAQPAMADAPTGAWIDPVAGDTFKLDFDKRTWEAVDMGCDIKSVTQKSSKQWKLALTCGTELDNNFNLTMGVKKTAKGLRIKIDGEDNYTELVREKAQRQVTPYTKSSGIIAKDDAWAGTEGVGQDDIYKWAASNKWKCYQSRTDEMLPCPITQAVSKAHILRGAQANPNRILFIGTATLAGNDSHKYGMIFERDQNGRFRPVTKTGEISGIPSKANFGGRALLLTTATPKDNDASCCPTGRTVWNVDYKTGRVKYKSGNKP